MLILKDLPNQKILSKFAERYADANIDQVIQFLTLLRVSSDLSSALDSYLAKHGLLQGRWWVLILLMREDDLMSSPSALAEKAGVTRATMTGLLDGLTKEGHVIRVSDTTDGRKFQIKLTAKGQQKLDEVMPEYYQRVGALMSAITPQESEQLALILGKLQTNISVFD